MGETKFCVKCGKSIPNESEFCPYCGASQPKLDTAETQDTNVIKPQQNAQSTTAVQKPTDQPEFNTAAFLTIGWLCAIASLFFPLIGIVALILSIVSTSKAPSKAGSIVLLVFTCVFFYLGITGFGTGFMNGING